MAAATIDRSLETLACGSGASAIHSNCFEMHVD